jgi:DNA-directed RNA polymerase specialized sigma24 family protein
VSKEYSYLSVDQFLQGYQALTDGDIRRLVGVCYSLRNVYRLQLEPKDLMQEALTRIIGSDRRIPEDVSLVVGIANVIKSIANDLVNSASNRSWQLEVVSDEIDGDMPNVLVFSASPEDELLEEQEVAAVSEKVKAIFLFFEHDAEVLSLLRLITKGLKAKDIVKDTFGGSQVKYDTTRKRLMRGIAKMKVEGAEI